MLSGISNLLIGSDISYTLMAYVAPLSAGYLVVVVPEDVVWWLRAVLDQAGDVHHAPLV